MLIWLKDDAIVTVGGMFTVIVIGFDSCWLFAESFTLALISKVPAELGVKVKVAEPAPEAGCPLIYHW